MLTIIGGELFLPESTVFKLPFMPPFDKHNLPFVCLLIGFLFKCPGRVTKIPRERWIMIMTFILIAGSVMTALTNRDVIEQKFSRPTMGLSLNDGLFMAVNKFSRISLPFFLGYSLFKSGADLRLMLISFSIGAVLYIPFELWEIRMSPNLNYVIYGFFQDDFNQTKRWGGYRPMVFMKHGLALARFAVCGVLAPFIIGRARAFFGVSWKLWRWVLLVVLVLSKSTGATLYVLFALPLVIWANAFREARVAVIIAMLVFLYPMLRLTGAFPTDAIIRTSNSLVGAERTQSLDFRFTNENTLVARAWERGLFGWGQYGRNFPADRSGHSAAVADGYWIIECGESGVAGYVGTFGILLLPVFVVWRRLKLIPEPSDRVLLSGAALLLSIVALDLLPNGIWSFYPYLIAGAIAGVSRDLAVGPARAMYATPGGAEARA